MTAYTPNNAFTPPQRYDLSDLVQGGPTGAANIPLEALADETNYLYLRRYRWEGVKTVNGSYLIDPVADLGQFLIVSVNANATVTLPDATALQAGTRVAISAAITGINAVTVLTQSNQPIVDGAAYQLTWDTAKPGMYMHNGEKLFLIAAGNYYIVEQAIGNFYTYGDTYAARVQRGNTVVADGTIYQ